MFKSCDKVCCRVSCEVRTRTITNHTITIRYHTYHKYVWYERLTTRLSPHTRTVPGSRSPPTSLTASPHHNFFSSIHTSIHPYIHIYVHTSIHPYSIHPYIIHPCIIHILIHVCTYVHTNDAIHTIHILTIHIIMLYVKEIDGCDTVCMSSPDFIIGIDCRKRCHILSSPFCSHKISFPAFYLWEAFYPSSTIQLCLSCPLVAVALPSSSLKVLHQSLCSAQEAPPHGPLVG